MGDYFFEIFIDNKVSQRKFLRHKVHVYMIELLSEI